MTQNDKEKRTESLETCLLPKIYISLFKQKLFQSLYQATKKTQRQQKMMQRM